MTDLWLHNRVKTLENVPTSTAPTGSVQSLFGVWERFDNTYAYGAESSNSINGNNSYTLNTYGYRLIRSRGDQDNTYNWYNGTCIGPVLDSCNATHADFDVMAYKETHKSAGYSNTTTYNYPNIGIRMMAVENTTGSDITRALEVIRTAYSSYSQCSTWVVTPSTLVDGKYTDVNETNAGGASNLHAAQSVTVTIPANTVAMIFNITHWKYYTGVDTGYIGQHLNGFSNLSNFFADTGLKPRNDFVKAAYEGGIPDQGSVGPWNYWNNIILNKTTTPTGYSHLE
jgi:hypothetical protein